MLRRRMHGVMLFSLLSGMIGGGLVTLLCLTAPVGADDAPGQSPKIASAEEFRLVDKEGRLRGLIALSADGEPYLALLDGNDTRRVWLGIAAAETGVAVRDIDGKTRLLLSIDNQGEPSLVVRDRQHRAKMFHP